MNRLQHLLPPTLFLLLGLAALATVPVTPLRYDTPLLGRVAGAIVVVAGIALSSSGSRAFDRVGTNILPHHDPEILVEAGPFTWTRNPMYLGLALALAGWAAALSTVLAWFAPVAFWVTANFGYIRFEETRMAAVFGDRWDDYRRRVPRWVGPITRAVQETAS